MTQAPPIAASGFIQSAAAGACAFAAAPVDNPPSAQKNGRLGTQGGARYDQFKITPPFQRAATLICAIEHLGFAAQIGSSAANYLPASRGA
jgi:hypothetical protein